MMDSIKDTWSITEKEIAQEMFNRAYKREIETLIKDIREKASAIADLNELWQLHDHLSAKRHEIEGKYEYDYTSLLFVFAELVRDGWLHLDELNQLDRGKLAKITALTKL